jgi:D-tyrosyl-tRNA(Tyr) deacylase
MRIVLQRISEARVDVEGVQGERAGAGLLALVGFREGDHNRLLEPMASKIAHLRIFEDQEGRMNKSLLDIEGDLVLVSQFTLYADCKKGRRPGFSEAMASAQAAELFENFCRFCGNVISSVSRGEFGTDMKVHLVNDGPVTIILDSAELGLD